MENNKVALKLKRVGYKIKSRRNELKLSLRELARTCGVSASFIGAVENGKNMPSMIKLKEIADALELTLSYLLDEDGVKENTRLLMQNIDKDEIFYRNFLKKHVFPNGLTYEEMQEKLKNFERIAKIIKAQD